MEAVSFPFHVLLLDHRCKGQLCNIVYIIFNLHNEPINNWVKWCSQWLQRQKEGQTFLGSMFRSFLPNDILSKRIIKFWRQMQVTKKKTYKYPLFVATIYNLTKDFSLIYKYNSCFWSNLLKSWLGVVSNFPKSLQQDIWESLKWYLNCGSTSDSYILIAYILQYSIWFWGRWLVC